MRSLLYALSGVLGVALVALPALAAYPEQPITLVVAFGEGSDSDLFARTFVRHLAKHLPGAHFRLSYRPGNAGVLAATSIQSAPADGYTLLGARVASQIIAPTLDPGLPYRWSSFTTIGVVEILPLICAVRADAPYRDARELLAAIRRRPGELRYGTSGAASIGSFSAQYLFHLAGLEADAARAVHLAKADEVADALLGGQVDFTCNYALTLIPLIQNGRLRGLFTTAPGRLAALPQLPNAREAGVRDMGQIIGWNALVGPPGLPVAVVTRWRAVLGRLMQDAAWQAEVATLGGLPALRAVPDPEKFIRQQERVYAQLVPFRGDAP